MLLRSDVCVCVRVHFDYNKHIYQELYCSLMSISFFFIFKNTHFVSFCVWS
jgi:hypothetical protein